MEGNCVCDIYLSLYLYLYMIAQCVHKAYATDQPGGDVPFLYNPSLIDQQCYL